MLTARRPICRVTALVFTPHPKMLPRRLHQHHTNTHPSFASSLPPTPHTFLFLRPLSQNTNTTNTQTGKNAQNLSQTNSQQTNTNTNTNTSTNTTQINSQINSQQQQPQSVAASAKTNAVSLPVVAWHKVVRAWVWIKEGAWHYWIGGRLLVKNVQLSSRLLSKSLQGVSLSRREDKMLRRTVMDLMRLIPFAAFVIIPFMELLLPVALKLFPNMLPSTFEDKMKREENMRKRLRVKLKMAEIMQQSIHDMVTETRSRDSPGSASAAELEHFMEKMRKGELVNNGYILRFSKLFTDEFTLDSLSREQLVVLCKYMGLNQFGTKTMLRMRLERRLQEIRQDDKDIAWEGVRSLTNSELQQACLFRGMRPYLKRNELELQLEQWLDLSRRNVPPSLLLMSRIFMITDDDLNNSAETLANAMLSIPEDAVEHLVMEKRILSNDKWLSNQQRLEYLAEQEQIIREEESENEKPMGEDSSASATTESRASRGEGVSQETQIKEICEAILTLSSPSAFNLELEELQKLKDQVMQETADSVEEDDPANRNKVLISRFFSHIQTDISNMNRSVGQGMRVLDSDNDGVINLEELKSATARLQNHPNPELVARLFDKFDPDRDGVIKLTDVRYILERLAAKETAKDVLGD